MTEGFAVTVVITGGVRSATVTATDAEAGSYEEKLCAAEHLPYVDLAISLRLYLS